MTVHPLALNTHCTSLSRRGLQGLYECPVIVCPDCVHCVISQSGGAISVFSLRVLEAVQQGHTVSLFLNKMSFSLPTTAIKDLLLTVSQLIKPIC